MFKIHGGATAFDQWSNGYALTNEHMVVGDRVSFRTACGGLRIMYAYDEGGTVKVNVPNQLLQDTKPIIVDLSGRPGCKTIFDVNPHDKPDDYVCLDADRHDPNATTGGTSGGSSVGGGAPYRTDRETVWEATIQTEYMEDSGFVTIFPAPPFEITEHHQRYVVEFDGVEYACYSHIQNIDGEKATALGNLRILEIEGHLDCYHNLLIPFTLINQVIEGEVMCCLMAWFDTEPTSHTIKVTKETIVSQGAGHVVVTLSGRVPDDGTDPLRLDRSFGEILTVCKAGVFPILWYKPTATMYQLMSYDDSLITFFSLGSVGTTLACERYEIVYDGCIYYKCAYVKEVE